MYHVPGPRGISPGYFLPQQGIVTIFFSGVGRVYMREVYILYTLYNKILASIQSCFAVESLNAHGAFSRLSLGSILIRMTQEIPY